MSRKEWIKGQILGDLNIGTGITVVTTEKGTYEIRILKLIDNIGGAGLGPKTILVLGCGYCQLDVIDLEVTLNLLFYSRSTSAAQTILDSFKPISKTPNITDSNVNKLVEESLKEVKVALTLQSAEEFLSNLEQGLDLNRRAISMLKIGFRNKDKEFLATAPKLLTPTTKDLANKLLKILEEEEEKSI